MAVVHHILEEERRRLEQLVEFYEAQHGVLPRGSISVKKRRDREYCYLAFRDGSKVRFKYLGVPDSDAVAEMMVAIRKRKDVEAELIATRQALKEVERSLRGNR